MLITMRDADVSLSVADANGNLVPYVPGEGSWANASGGALAGADSKSRAGGGGEETAVGGPATRADLTITTQWTDITATWIGPHELAVRRRRRAKIAIVWHDPELSPLGVGSLTRTGVLKEAAEPDVDHNSGEVGMYTVVMSCDEVAA